MNALQKVAWAELAVSILAVALVAALYPWLGGAAAGGFGVLGLLGVTPLLMRNRGVKVVHDERDQAIEKQAAWAGFGFAWMLMLASLAVVTMWHSYHEREVAPGLLNIMIWIQFAFCYAVKGAATLLQYRGPHGAS